MQHGAEGGEQDGDELAGIGTVVSVDQMDGNQLTIGGGSEAL